MSNTSLLGSYGGQAGDGLFFRNRILNGAMTIDQRNSGAAVTLGVGSTYVLDRFYSQASQASKVSVQRSSLAPAGFTNSLQSTVLAAVTPGAADYFTTARQNIEGFNVADLGWGTADAQSISISFWVRSSVVGTYSYFVLNNSGSRGYIANFTVSASNTWEYKTLVIPGDTSGTWEKTNSTGIGTGVDLGSGSNYHGTAGAWTSTDKLRTAGSVNWISNAGATFQITGVQLEAGPTATPFERRPIGVELALCQRYYWRENAGAGNTNYKGLVNPFSTTRVIAAPFSLPVPLRADNSGLTVTFSGIQLWSYALAAQVSVTAITVYVNAANSTNPTIDMTCNALGSTSQPYMLSLAAGTGFIAFSAEL